MAFIEARCKEATFERGVSPLQVMYGIHGEHELDESDLNHLAGYLHSRPVWIGNWAWRHLQLDIYGELLDAVYLYNKWGRPVSYGSQPLTRTKPSLASSLFATLRFLDSIG